MDKTRNEVFIPGEETTVKRLSYEAMAAAKAQSCCVARRPHTQPYYAKATAMKQVEQSVKRRGCVRRQL